MDSVVGTVLYQCPEIIQAETYGEKADVWALGCILYQMATLRPPFEGGNPLVVANNIVDGRCIACMRPRMHAPSHACPRMQALTPPHAPMRATTAAPMPHRQCRQLLHSPLNSLRIHALRCLQVQATRRGLPSVVTARRDSPTPSDCRARPEARHQRGSDPHLASATHGAR